MPYRPRYNPWLYLGSSGNVPWSNRNSERKIGPKQKRTKWWNNRVKEKIQEKKVAWKRYLETGEEEDKRNYINKRNESKEEVNRAKKESCEEFSKEVEETFKDNQGNKKEFWTTI
ncbi:hypothetical protein FQA39_LY12071 [Lamprigera yunnana]|nr:hypothetical protein FQA39_LY12071 [Lamprigera yunnana]